MRKWWDSAPFYVRELRLLADFEVPADCSRKPYFGNVLVEEIVSPGYSLVRQAGWGHLGEASCSSRDLPGLVGALENAGFYRT